MDIHMPVMDGLEASSKITELGIKTPIVALTANIMSNDMEIYKQRGMYDTLGKPFTSQELWSCLLTYIPAKNYSVVNEQRENTANEKLQNQLIIQFVKNNKNKYEEIINAISDSDIKLAHRLAHTLRGNAGQLKKTELQKAAADVEKQLKDNISDAASEKMKLLEKELNAVLAELEPLVNEIPPAQTGELLDIAAAKLLLDELEPVLKAGNTKSLTYIDKLRSIPGTEELIQQIEGFKFKPAIETLAELKKKLG
ncbi:MAG: response regulator, partial [Treponema sp.]|nr:response regulator [Treponema sp.]